MSFDLQVNDFDIEKKKIKVISSWVDPEFQREQEKLGNVFTKKAEPVLLILTKTIKMNGKYVDISFTPDSEDEIKNMLGTVNIRLNYIEAHENEIIDAVIEKITKLKNKGWLSEGEKSYSISKIKEQLGAIKCISFYTLTSTSVFITDNKLFHSHDIEIRMNKQRINEVLLTG